MTAEKKTLAEANRLSAMLNAVLGTERFPVEVAKLALEYSRQCFPDSPVDKVQGDALEDFDGMLVANKARTKWLILYISAVRCEGRQRFTIAHEFGHYLLHRHQQNRFECSNADIETGEGTGRDIETKADTRS